MLALALLALAACERTGGEEGGDGPGFDLSGIVTRPVTDVDDVATAVPGEDRGRGRWRAADEGTRGRMGYLTASVEGRGGPLMLAFAAGVTVQAERDVRLPASELAGPDGRSFSDVTGADPSAGVFLYRVLSENVDRSAPQGGLCGKDRATYLAVSEFVGQDGEWLFKIASFKGPAPPGPGAPADPQLCGAYQFVQA